MSKPLMGLFGWLEQHNGLILLAGSAASLVINLRAFQNDRKAAQRLREIARQAELPESQPLVSFLVPAWNEVRQVEACIRSIRGLRYAHKELVICAGGEDGTLAICRRLAGEGVIVVEQRAGEGKQGALRQCFEHSSGEILFLTDADSSVDDDCVEATLAPLLLRGESAATGYFRPHESAKTNPFVIYQWATHLRYQASMPNYVEDLVGSNSAIQREALAAAGAFQNEANIGTDYVLSQRLKAAGYRICSVVNSRVKTEYAVEIGDYLQQSSRWYRNRLVQGVRYRQWQDVYRSLWGAAASLFMLGGGLALPLGWKAMTGAWLAAWLHLALSAGRLAAFFRLAGFGGERLLATWMRFTSYTMISDIAMIKGLADSLFSRNRRQW